MTDEASYTCDSCGEEIVVPIALSAGTSQEYVEDCPVCCRPNVIHVEVEEDGDVRVLAYSLSCEIKDLLANTQPPTPLPTKAEATKLFMDRVLPPSLSGLGAKTTERLLQLVDETWADVDDCYEFDWDPAARPAERKWVCGICGPAADRAWS